MYFRNFLGQRDGWEMIANESDLFDGDELRGILEGALA
jgi:hypothetical protein